MSEIYIILKTLKEDEDDKTLFENSPISYALTESGASEILRDSLPMLEQIVADLKVWRHDKTWLHVTYTDLETGHHMRAIYTVRKVCNTTLAL